MEIKINFKQNLEYRLMDQTREVLRYYHYSYRIKQSYSLWILQYIKFNAANHIRLYIFGCKNVS